MVALIVTLLFQASLNTVNSIDAHRNYFDYQKASQQQLKLSDTCENKISIPSFALTFDASVKTSSSVLILI